MRKQAMPLKDLGDEAADMILGQVTREACLTLGYPAASYSSYSKCLLRVSTAGNRFGQVGADDNTFAHALSKLSEIVLWGLWTRVPS